MVPTTSVQSSPSIASATGCALPLVVISTSWFIACFTRSPKLPFLKIESVQESAAGASVGLLPVADSVLAFDAGGRRVE